MTVRFHLNKGAIYCRIRHNNTMATFSTSIKCDSDSWDQEMQRVIGRDFKGINQQVSEIRQKIFDLSYKHYYAKEVIDALLNKSENITLSELIEQVKELKSEKIADGTKKHYNTLKTKVLEYKDVNVKAVDVNYIKNFYLYLKKTTSHNRAVFLIKNKLNTVFNTAINYDMMSSNPTLKFDVAINKKDIEFLTTDEVERLSNKEIPNERLSKIRDIFLFQCYTGMEYSRVKELTESNLSKVDKQYVLTTKRQKTKNAAIIPLMPKAVEILEQYRGQRKGGYLFPVPSNQKMNAYLKEIADICDIDKELHTHLARHTFATIALNHDMPIHIVAEIMGISDLKTLRKYYAVVLKSTTISEMNKLSDKLRK